MIKLILLLCFMSAAAAKRYDGYHLIQFEDVWGAFRQSLPYLKSRQVVHFTDPSDTMDLVIAPELVTLFTKDKDPGSYNIIKTNIQEWIDRERTQNEDQKLKEKSVYGDELPLAAPERYLRYQEVQDWMTNIANRHSDKASIEVIGQTFENRDMRVLKISTGSGRRKIWLDCGIHAREWIAPSTCLWITAKLLNEYRSNADSRRMLDNFDWFVVPVANPDGYEYTFEVGDEGDRLWRKNRRPTDDDPECIGADTNRNWDIQWNGEGVSPFPCLDTWPGDGPFSEPSTQVLSRYIDANKQNMIMLISMHSFTQLWLVPYAYDEGAYPPDYLELERVGNETALAIRAVNGRGFIVGTPPDILYAASGSSMDWAKSVAGIKYSYSPELRPEGLEDGGFIIDAVPNIRESGEEIYAGIARATQLI